MKHILFTYNGTVYSRHKDWDFNRCERVLERLGATYWEIGDGDADNLMKEKIEEVDWFEWENECFVKSSDMCELMSMAGIL